MADLKPATQPDLPLERPATTATRLLLSSTGREPADLAAALQGLRNDVEAEGRALFERWLPHIRRRSARPSLLNLAHYLSLRKYDLRDIQERLAPLGLSSLGRSESRVMPTLDSVLSTLLVLAATPAAARLRPPLRAFTRGDRMLDRNTLALFGVTQRERETRIMVTLGADAASDYAGVKRLIEAGMDCARVNCSHDDADVWAAMIANIRRAEQETGKACKVTMDLCGPRARTEAVIVPHDGHRLHPGDRLLMTRDEPVAHARFAIQAQCGIPEVIDQLEMGAEVWVDGGKLGLRVVGREPEGVELEVAQTRPKGGKLQPEKGLNFPRTHVRLSPLTDKDVDDLDFVAKHADAISYSFVQETGDIDRLHRELEARGRDPRDVAVILKIETDRAIHNLPELIVHAAGRQPVGVMIARGDLAVEIGFTRLAEIQEELLWVCEAAHAPVVWATEVLERLSKKGTPSRAEMTDAAMAERAECVMLNKGPYVAEAVRILDEVIVRMEGHQDKKRARMRALSAWQAV